MEETPKNSNKLLKILLFLFVSFLIMVISKETGLYEYQVHNKTNLTKEAMLKFESDVEKGLDVSINDYLDSEYNDYSNIVTKTGTNLNKFVESFMNKGIKKTLKVLSRLFYE